MIVLDASVWVDVLAAGAELPELAEHDLKVPPHFDMEVVGGIRALNQHGQIGSQQADDALQRHLRAPLDRILDQRDIERAWKLREALSIADAWYVALAQRLRVSWLTHDDKAARTAQKYIQVQTARIQ